jgi:hypothetical protein
MQMQLGIESHIPDGLLAANALLAENSRQGVPTSTQALYQGFGFAISSTYMGLQFRCYESASDPVVAPNKVTSAIKSWWKDVSSCFTNYALPTLESDLNPVTPGVMSPADMVSQLSQASLAGAASWSVSNGLTVPLRSSIVRAGVSNAEALGKASVVLSLAGIDVALADAVYAEYKGCL